MKEITIQRPADIHKIFNKYRKSSKFKFRGHSKSDWKLVPKAGRLQYSKTKDKELFRHWMRRASGYITQSNLSEWDYLAIAQHTGLPTRLLDWTHNPLVAAFFSANEHVNDDGCIYVVGVNQPFANFKFKSPFDISLPSISFIQPSSASQRVANQLSYFSLHNESNQDLLKQPNVDSILDKIVIPKELKQELVFSLNHYGINYLTLFPDLEGLSKHLCWFSENYEYWDGIIEEE